MFSGGIKVYGGNGEYMTKVKLFDLGDSDLERDGRLIAESDEVMYECASGCKYPIQFEAPVSIKVNFLIFLHTFVYYSDWNINPL